MKAITDYDGPSVVDREKCIGCGLCVTTCSTKAITLRKKKKENVPPRTPENLYMKILAKKVGNWGMIKIGIKKLLRHKV